MKNKICHKCGKKKSVSDFTKTSSKYADGYHCYCKDCTRKIGISYYKEHKDEIKVYRNNPKNKKRMQKWFQSYKGVYSHLKQGAERRGIEVTFNENEFKVWYEKQLHICHYCKITEEKLKKLKFGKTKRLTIDRKDNDKGYTLKNIVLACFRCNTIKGNFFTEKEMRNIGKIIKRKCDLFFK